MSSLATERPAGAAVDTGAAATRRNVHLVLDSRGLWDGTRCHNDLTAWAATVQPAADGPHLRLRVRRHLHLHLAGELLLECPCPPGLDFAHDGDRIDWACRLLQRYHADAAAARWPLAAWGGAAAGVTAWRQAGAAAADAQAWHAAADAAGLRLRTIRPLWATACATALRMQPALRRAAQATVLFAEGEAVCVLQLQRGRLLEVTRRQLAAPSVAALYHFVSDQGLASAGPVVALGAGLLPAVTDAAVPAPLQSLGDLTAALPWRPPAHSPIRESALPGPDFLRPRRRPGLWVWLALLGTVGLALFAAFEAWSLQQAVQQTRRATAAAALSLPARSIVAHPEAAMLAYPWRESLLAVEAATGPGLRWSSLDADHRGRLLLQGLAADDASVRELAARLRSAAPGREVTVARSEAVAEGQRFELQARVTTLAAPR